jgi:hypothetical protein
MAQVFHFAYLKEFCNDLEGMKAFEFQNNNKINYKVIIIYVKHIQELCCTPAIKP